MDTGGEYHSTTFLSPGNIPWMYLSMNEVRSSGQLPISELSLPYSNAQITNFYKEEDSSFEWDGLSRSSL